LLVTRPVFSQDVVQGDPSLTVDLATVAVPLAWTPPQQPVIPPPSLQPAPNYYSHGYDVRAKIHKYASFTTLPLVASEFVVGQSLFDDSESGWKKSTHLALGTTIGGLFAVNTVTGVWNLVQARKDPNRGHLPLIHSLLMFGADAGFVATAAITPGDHDGTSNLSNKGTHRALAFTSMGLATASYLIMFIGNR
jgi:hypothetical protein